MSCVGVGDGLGWLEVGWDELSCVGKWVELGGGGMGNGLGWDGMG